MHKRETSSAPTKLIEKEVSGIERCSEPVPKTMTSQSKKVTENVQWKRKGETSSKKITKVGAMILLIQR
jgi:hypothetical protein